MITVGKNHPHCDKNFVIMSGRGVPASSGRTHSYLNALIKVIIILILVVVILIFRFGQYLSRDDLISVPILCQTKPHLHFVSQSLTPRQFDAVFTVVEGELD